MRSITPQRHLLMALLILALVSVSCGQRQPVEATLINTPPPAAAAPTVVQAAQAATPTQAPALEETAAEQPSATAETQPSPEPTYATPTQAPAAQSAHAAYEGVSLDVPVALARDVTAAIDPGGYGDATITGEFGPKPEAYAFTLNGYILPDAYPDPQVLVFPVEAYQTVNAPAETQVEMLSSIISSGAPLVNFEPFLPLWNQWENFTAHDLLLPFKDGNGLRYLTCMSPYNKPVGRINSDCLMYTYQGLSQDGKYYISAILPVSLPVLDTPEMEARYRAAVDDSNALFDYAEAASGLIRSASPSDFKPALPVLDVMIQSIAVRPTITLKPPRLPDYAKNCATPKTYLRPGIRARVAFTDGKPLNVREKPGKKSKVVATLKEGAAFYVSKGPSCADKGLWWYIEKDTLQGYVMEAEGTVYFIEPAE